MNNPSEAAMRAVRILARMELERLYCSSSSELYKRRARKIDKQFAPAIEALWEVQEFLSGFGLCDFNDSLGGEASAVSLTIDNALKRLGIPLEDE